MTSNASITKSALMADVDNDLNPDVEVAILQSQHAKFLNSRTPVCSLPREILSWIFELTQAAEIAEAASDDCDIDDASVHILSFEVLISHVSSHFRSVALSTRKLWRSIDITLVQSIESIAAYISRSDGCGLLVRIKFDEEEPSEDELANFDVILPHSVRYHRLVVHIVNEAMDNPIIRHFIGRDVPMLEHLSISVDEVQETTMADAGIFRSAEKLSFVRLRGLAMSLFRPPLNVVTTLHLEQTLPLPIHFTTFFQILTASPFLANLSNLRSLRICGVSGMIYSGLLLGINAACLDSLVLKNAQEFDLENFWASPNVFKFPQLHSLTFCDFEFSSHAYADVFRAFPTITKFTTYSSTTPVILLLLAQPTQVDIPWPDLHTLTFLLHLDDDDLITDVVRNREAVGRPLVRLRLGTPHHPSVLRQYNWLQENVVLEKFEKLERWPATDFYADKDDDLFY